MNYSEPSIALEDIAKQLGIAVSTVSRALRDMPGIHPATRAKVLKASNALGYVPPRRKGDEAPAHPRNILMLTLDRNDEAPAGYLAGMSQAALLFNFSLLSHVFSEGDGLNLLNPNHQPPSMRVGLVDGIILIYRWPHEVVKALSRRWPTVSIVEHYPDLPIDVIGVDHVGGMFALVQHLHATGHQRIGFLGLRPDISYVRSRFAAYVEALLALDLPFHYEDVVSIHTLQAVYDPQSLPDGEAIESVARKIRQGVRAWVCVSDVVGNSLCAGLIQRGFRIPEDVAVTGFHRRQYPSANLQLTTTEVRDDLVGAAALRRLDYRLDHRDEIPRLILLPCNFLQGETTSPPSTTPAR